MEDGKDRSTGSAREGKKLRKERIGSRGRAREGGNWRKERIGAREGRGKERN